MTPREIFDEMVDSAWKSGEPGVVFLDTVNRVNTLPGLGPLEVRSRTALLHAALTRRITHAGVQSVRRAGTRRRSPCPRRRRLL